MNKYTATSWPHRRFSWCLGWLVLLTVHTSSQAQDLLTQGAEWHYNLLHFGSHDVGFNRCYIDGDTVIDERSCLIYIQEEYNCNGRPKRNYLYKEAEQVYFYDTEDTTFKLLYDFSLQAGDTMALPHWSFLGERSYFLRIDSVGVYPANDRALKMFHVSFGYMEGGDLIHFENLPHLADIIIEDIGSNINFFHLWDNGWCDSQYSNQLRCFSAPDYPEVQLGEDACTLVPTQDVVTSHPWIQAFPNPTSDQLSIRFQDCQPWGQVTVRDVAGQIVQTYQPSATSEELLMDLGPLPAAIYYIGVPVRSGRKIHAVSTRVAKIKD